MSTFVFVVAFCIVAVLVYMARYSGRLRVEQSRIIDAPLAAVYAQVADFAHWRSWNPWLEHEANAQLVFAGKTDAVGGVCSWSSPRAGEGRLEHLRLLPGQRIEQRMNFKQPFSFRGRGCWQFSEREGKTEVVWSMQGRVAFSLRAFAQTVQGMVLLDYRYGLDRLAASLEPADAPRYSITYLEVRDVTAQRYAYSTYEGPIKGLPAAMQTAFQDLSRRLAAEGISVTGEPVSIYLKTNIKRRTTLCRMGLPIGDAVATGLPVHEMPAHRAYGVRLKGNYDAMEVAWYQAMQRMRIENILPEQRIPPFERYLNDPAALGDNEWLTELLVPVRLPVVLQAA